MQEDHPSRESWPPGDARQRGGSPTFYEGLNIHPDALEVACNAIDEDCIDGAFQGNIRVPSDFGTMSAAIDAAMSEDTICVDGGDYGELVAVNGKNLTIRGNGQTRFHTGNGVRIYVAGSGTQRLENLVLDGGNATPLIQVSPDALLELKDVRASNVGCATSCSGAIAYLYPGARMNVERLVMEPTTLDFPIGVYLNGLFYADSAAELTVTDSTFDGSIYNVESNAASYLLGGFSQQFLTVFERVDISNNQLSGPDDVAILSPWGPLQLEDVRITNNTVEAGTSAAILRLPDRGGLTRVTITNNTLTASEIALIEVGLGMDVYNVVVAQNTMAGTLNGVFNVPTGSSLYATNMDIVDNTLDVGSTNLASAIWKEDGALVLLRNSNIVGGASPAIRSSGAVQISHSNLFDNPDPWVDMDGNPLAWTGFSLDPMYVQRPNLDLRLQPDSPMVDAGFPSILDADGSPSDVGANGGPQGDWLEPVVF